MSESTRLMLIESFDEIRPSFLAAIDQIVAEMRPQMLAKPDTYHQSLRTCAHVFSNPSLVRAQLAEIAPEVLATISQDEVVDAHLATISYLFSLILHEMIRNEKEVIDP